MKIIIAPARTMKIDNDTFSYQQLPCFLTEAQQIYKQLQTLTMEQLTKLWKTSPRIVEQNYQLLHHQNLTTNLTPAIIAFTGLQYQYMAPDVFSEDGLAYVESNLRIISGLYGLLRPFDGIVPYRLAMKESVQVNGCQDLYTYWGRKIYEKLYQEDDLVLDLASKEYEKVVTPYLNGNKQLVKCVFGELVDGKVKQKATLAKMARGNMVRFLAENQVQTIEGVKRFDVGGYQYQAELSANNKLVFTIEK